MSSLHIKKKLLHFGSIPQHKTIQNVYRHFCGKLFDTQTIAIIFVTSFTLTLIVLGPGGGKKYYSSLKAQLLKECS